MPHHGASVSRISLQQRVSDCSFFGRNVAGAWRRDTVTRWNETLGRRQERHAANLPVEGDLCSHGEALLGLESTAIDANVKPEPD